MSKIRLLAVMAAALFLSFTAQAMAQGQVKFNFSAQSWAMDAKFKRTEVNFETDEKPGTILIRTSQKHLYLVLPEGRAMRYGIGVGRDGFRWSGVERVTRKAEWPGWTPPPEMRQREPHLPAFMKGGPDNPLGARALYLGSTIYRIHGTAQPWTIGMNVSSGCIRLQNEDVIDLYERVKVGAKVIIE
jgi:lipoprotein-anchoring transpeptidase ErfK/SrfK